MGAKTNPENTDVAVFNRTGGMLGYLLPGYPYIELPENKWSLTDTYGKPLPRAFVTNHLLSDPRVTVENKYAKWFGKDNAHLTVAACIDPVTGWGNMNYHLIDALAELRDDMVMYPTTYWHENYIPQRVLDLMHAPYHPTQWGLALTVPSEIQNIPARNLILFSMWETGKLPDDWALPLKSVKHLIVPAKSQVDLFRQHYHGEISVVPLGVDITQYPYVHRPPRGDAPFTILLYASPLTSRKSPLETLTEVCYRAFSDVYGAPIDDWKLILKTRMGVLGAGAFPINIQDPHVEVIDGTFAPHEMLALHERADVGIALSRYEGFGLCFREMMATGLPVIVSNSSGHADDCDVILNIPIDAEQEQPALDMYGLPDWKWFEPNWEQAARSLRHEYNMWKLRGKTQSPLGTHASDYIQQHRTWKHTAREVNAIVESKRLT